MSILSRITERFFGSTMNDLVTRRVNLSVREIDRATDRPWNRAANEKDRYAWNRADILRDALLAWRENPLARRIVGLTSQYVVGGGLSIASEDEGTDNFLQEWWKHRLNRMTTRAFEWCDELTRSGELFIVLSTDGGGMSYMRAIPASEIDAIESAPNDLEQEISFTQKVNDLVNDGIKWPAYNEQEDTVQGGAEDGKFKTVMLHYAINRPVGAQFGESDLAPMLKWLVRHGAWLEDRVRLNRFRQSFLFWVKKPFRDNAERLARQSELNSNPPPPGSILVTNDDEEWEVIHPKLDSFEASEDGLAVKKLIATGAGVPLHFLAEPEGATRTTAEQAGGPTFRHFEQRQIFFLWMLEDIARIVVRRAAASNRKGVKPDAPIKARGTDIFSRDNAGLAASAAAIIEGFGFLRDRGLIDDAEYLRLAYRFAGEVVDVSKVLADGRKAGPTQSPVVDKPDRAAAIPDAKDIAKQEIETEEK